jgi:hypothetical protein
MYNMNKKQRIIIGISFMLLFTGIVLTTSYASSDVIISAFDQNATVSDEGNEWVSLETPLTDFVSKSHPMAIPPTGT